jgi:2-phosphoglycolate phosphatase
MPVQLRYKAVLFDLDGTLINSATDLVNSVQHALRQVTPEREVPDGDDILIQVGKPLEVILRELQYPHDPASTTKFVDTYRAHYAEHFNEHTKLYPGVTETLESLRRAGARLALVTTKHQVQADFTAKESGLLQYFDYVHGWQEGREHKPHPEPVLTALARLGAEPGQAIMVGDSEMDIEAGKAAGTATCGVTHGFRPVWFLRSLAPDYLLSSIVDLLPIVIESRD